eukprot:TRINITY_DN16358_c0_g2_i1.p1 TRINITY_DN16358_c0_g2~~TRINITY_DN16358_c0_g2_i1.p1  ORF type:complete len:332 (-),score=87.53 TRINITY_DN16358_c0_g2_i1:129-1124(-)
MRRHKTIKELKHIADENVDPAVSSQLRRQSFASDGTKSNFLYCYLGYFFMNAVELIAESEDSREDFYFVEPCTIGLAEGIKKTASSSSSTDQLCLTPKQVIRNLVAFMCENYLKLDSSFFLELENSSCNFSFGTSKTPDANLSSLDQIKNDRLFSGSQDLKDSGSHVESRNAAICLLRADEVYCATSGETCICMIRFCGTIPELIKPTPKITKKISKGDISNPRSMEENKKDHVVDDLKAYNMKIQASDLLIIGSSSLFTVVSEIEILELAREYAEREGFTEVFPQSLAKEIGNFARSRIGRVSAVGRENVVIEYPAEDIVLIAAWINLVL